MPAHAAQREALRVIVTRPRREAQSWQEMLQGRGFDALALPLIAISPVNDSAALREAWRGLANIQAVMFVSANAVSHFFDAAPDGLRSGWLDGSVSARAWATGPGTRQALLDAGVPEMRIDCPASTSPQFDSETLWRLVAAQIRAGSRVLIVRGGDAGGVPAGRDWLAAQLEGAGGVCDAVVAYARTPPAWSTDEAACARQAAADGSIWLFSSSEAIANLAALVPAQRWGQARAVATHPRIAQAARDAGFGVVCESRPALAEVVASIESL